MATQKKELENLIQTKENKDLANQRDENEISKEVVRLTSELTHLKEELEIKNEELAKVPVVEEAIAPEVTKKVAVQAEDIAKLTAINDELKQENEILTEQLATKTTTAATTVEKEKPKLEDLLTEDQKADLSKIALLKKMEGLGFEYRKTAVNSLNEKVAVGVKQRGDHLIVQLFYLNDAQENNKNPQASVRLQSSKLYDYKVLRYGEKPIANVTYDVEVKTAIGDQKLTNYIAAYLEDIQTYRQEKSGNGQILFEQIFLELKLRSVPTLTGNLSVAQRKDFPWLKPYLTNLGFHLPPGEETGKIKRDI